MLRLTNRIGFSFIVFILLVSYNTCFSQAIIPQPSEIIRDDGNYSFGTTIYFSAANTFDSEYSMLSEYFNTIFGVTLERKKNGGNIAFKTSDRYADEEYMLIVDKKGAYIEGSESGVFYGMRTLQQMFDQYGLSIPYVKIKDSPRFSWRGLMLDCGRYFYPVSFIKHYIDRMSYYKLNVFHWHLSEDGGWRIEIKSHPELVQASAWRRSTQKRNDGTQDNIPHGGYYTQDQIREIVKYAEKRNVTIVPEIDLPGHTKSILAAHPELNCTGETVFPEIRWKIWDDVLCVGNPATLQLIKDILSELIDLFPSEYINIGGDEAPQNHWEKCQKCQALMKSESIKSPRGLQNWLTMQMNDFVRSKGRKIIGWDEILEGGTLGKDAAVMSWRNSMSGYNATKLGNKVVMSPTEYMYIDYYQSDDIENEPFAIGGFLPLEKVYSYEPVSKEYSKEQIQLVLGVQANLWCEYVHSPDHSWYMTFPRGLAVAEIGWSGNTTKDYEDFRNRMTYALRAMDRDQIPFRIPEPLGLFNPKVDNGNVIIDLKSPVSNAQIYYTTDGTDPQYHGMLYTGKITMPLTLNGVNFTCMIKLPSGRFSAPYRCRFR